MRVIHVVPAVAAEASGPSYSVSRLCESLGSAGVDSQVAALDWNPIVGRPYLKLFPLGMGVRRLGASPSMQRWLTAESKSGRADIIHNHGLWMMPNLYAGRACRNGKSRLIVSPRGTLSDWALGWGALKKKVFWRIWQEPALRGAACLHATADSEVEDIRRIGFRQPICVLPNGVDVPAIGAAPRAARRRLLFLGRIHPKKGIDILLRAWAAVSPRFQEWDLHVAGPDDGGYLCRMEALAAELRLDRVTFCGPLYGADKMQAYRSASIFVLPTHSENFGMTVAESLAAGTPVIVSKGAPWSAIESRGAGWWIDVGVDPLVACLEAAMRQSPARIEEMGCAGRAWMADDFSWPKIAACFARTYDWVLNGGTKPEWVRSN